MTLDLSVLTGAVLGVVASPSTDAELVLAAARRELADAYPGLVLEVGAPGGAGMPLLLAGREYGVLRTSGPALPADAVRILAHALAVALAVDVERARRRYGAAREEALSRLLREGITATSVEEAGELVARVTADVFATERAAVYLLGDRGVIRHVIGVGLDEELGERLRSSLVGLVAADSPVFRRTQLSGGPLLIGDVAATSVRAGGFVRTLGLSAFVAMPLLSASGQAGLVMCGETGPRQWTPDDEALARQLALQAAVVVDAARLRQAEQHHLADLTHRALHDALTGLANRAALLDALDRAVLGGEADAGQVALLLVDLDGFKAVNDEHGHGAGDVLLQHVAARLRHAVRDDDLVARLGGDELAVLLAPGTDGETALEVARRVDARLREPFDITGSAVRISGAVGLAVLPRCATDAAGLLAAADAAMYRSKREGDGPAVARPVPAPRAG
ncbi:diguanylate cyclase (GGDEF)-like protein [Motilibacter rhizosphaerae]|uniref:Diguanylate cyclase (GGDEF)-like protein n=1 Tax=Motilibacter rhizosphaerae TaxID=598652 RepID=A0A4Q7NQK0_9ACTN|nr:sensor domain-containing diguanylate cyclase [Motilibacter rhizosphaerae]RZS87614.1 diguanylate cyclase (GGDEF)-like protein [Motilibacter rhizosphaerae]